MSIQGKIKISKKDYEYAQKFVSDDMARPALQRMALYKKSGDEKIYLIATNGFHIYYKKLNISLSDTVLMHTDIPLDFDEEFSVVSVKSHSILYSKDKYLIQPNLAADYPKVDKIIDSLSGHKVSFNKKDILYTLRGLQAFHGRENSGVILERNGDKIKLSSKSIFSNDNSEYTFNDEVIGSINKSIDRKLRFKTKYLINMIDPHESEEIVMFVNPDTHLAYIKNKGLITLAMEMQQ